MTTPRLPTDSLIIDSVESEQARGARVESKQRELEDVRSERDGLEELLTRSRGELSEHMQELESMLTAIRQETDALTGPLAAGQSSRAAMERELGAARDQLRLAEARERQSSQAWERFQQQIDELAQRFKQLRSAFGEADRRVQEAIEVTKAGRAALVEERAARAQCEIELRSMAEPRGPVHADGLEAPRRLRGAQREVVELHARLDAAESFDVAEESKEPSPAPQADLLARRTGSDGRSGIGSFLDVRELERKLTRLEDSHQR